MDTHLESCGLSLSRSGNRIQYVHNCKEELYVMLFSSKSTGWFKVKSNSYLGNVHGKMTHGRCEKLGKIFHWTVSIPTVLLRPLEKNSHHQNHILITN